MNEETGISAVKQTSLAKPLTAGLIGWAVGILLLLAAAWPVIHPEVFSIAAMWAVSHWWIAFLFGAVVLVVSGRVSRQPVGNALLAYLLPVGILAAICGICIAIYPDFSFREDLLNSLALVVMFQGVGILWISCSRDGDKSSRFVRSVFPAIVGGLIILTMIAIPVFMGNPFIYRNAFALSVSKSSLNNGALLAEAVLEIKKPGNYEFTAPRYIYSDAMASSDDEESVEFGKITWGSAGPPADGSTGSFPFQVRWEKNIPATEAELNRGSGMENPIYLEVHNPKEPAGNLLYNVYASTPVVAP